jgi:hypothetical protein
MENHDETVEGDSAYPLRPRLGRLYALATLALLLSVAALGWLAWLSPPTQLVKADRDEPRVAVPEERLAPSLRIGEIRSDIDDLQAQLGGLAGTAGLEDLEARVEELEVQVLDLEDSVSDIDDRVSEVEFNLSDVCSS